MGANDDEERAVKIAVPGKDPDKMEGKYYVIMLIKNLVTGEGLLKSKI